MKTLELQPEQIIVPGEYELSNETALRVYFDLCSRGHSKVLSPVIVTSSDITGKAGRQKRLTDKLEKLENFCKGDRKKRCISDDMCVFTLEEYTERLTDIYTKLETKVLEAPYYLIDGNHRAIAATLTHSPIYAFELSTDADLAQIRLLAEEGRLPSPFNREETEINDLVVAFEKFVLNHIEHLGTVKERVDKLTSNGDLPQFMKDRYKK